MSIYEVTIIEPNESFMARDLIIDRGQVQVTGTIPEESMLQGNDFAMRIVQIDGHWTTTVGKLPYSRDMTRRLTEIIHSRARGEWVDFDGTLHEDIESPELSISSTLTTFDVMKLSAPIISES